MESQAETVQTPQLKAAVQIGLATVCACVCVKLGVFVCVLYLLAVKSDPSNVHPDTKCEGFGKNSMNYYYRRTIEFVPHPQARALIQLSNLCIL